MCRPCSSINSCKARNSILHCLNQWPSWNKIEYHRTSPLDAQPQFSGWKWHKFEVLWTKIHELWVGCNQLDIFPRKVKHISKNEPSNPDNRVLEHHDSNVIPMAEWNPVNAYLTLLGRNFVNASRSYCVRPQDWLNIFYVHHEQPFLKQPLKCITNSKRSHEIQIMYNSFVSCRWAETFSYT